MKFNINENVKVKLSEAAIKILYDQHQKLWVRTKGLIGPFVEPKKDAEGYSTFQFWVLMQTFGPHIEMTKPSPFLFNTLVIENKAVREAYGLLEALTATAHRHNFSEDQINLLNEVTQNLKAEL